MTTTPALNDDLVRELREISEDYDLGPGTSDVRRALRLSASALEAQSKEIEALRSALEQARKPDMFWSYDDPEQAWDGFEEAIREAGYGNEVVRLMTGKTLGDAWVANRVLTVDDEGDPDETEEVLFDNEAEALRCYPESLEAARTALKGA